MHRESVILDDVIVLAAMRDGHWRPGIGDPTFLGWVTVAAYFAAGVVSGRVWRLDLRARRAGDPTATPVFWLVLTLLLAFLGVNKQLDLQNLLTDVGRRLAFRQGWYGRRKEVQFAFIVAVGLFSLAGFGAFAWIARKNLKRNLTSLTGVVLLMAFVMIRAASFHHVNAFIVSTLGGVRWNPIMELGGIGLTVLGAVVAMLYDAGRTVGSTSLERPRA